MALVTVKMVHLHVPHAKDGHQRHPPQMTRPNLSMSNVAKLSRKLRYEFQKVFCDARSFFLGKNPEKLPPENTIRGADSPPAW